MATRTILDVSQNSAQEAAAAVHQLESQLELKTTKKETLMTSHFMIERKASKENFDAARKAIHQLGIKSSYDDSRMIFSTLHTHKNNLSNVYAQECNGLILELGTWKPLMVPPRSLRFNIDTETSNNFLHQGLYHIYKAQDGTCFNLYYYNNRWVISTAKGYDMNNVKWDSQTYQELISECLGKLETPLTWEEFTSKLNQKRCYSFGFKHPQFHRFYDNVEHTPVYKLWFIQSVDLDDASEQYLWASDKTPIEQIPVQEYYTTPVGNLKELYRVSMDALDNYINKQEVCYGFILRSVNFETTGQHSDLFVESSLMRVIRKFWYENNIIDVCHANKWNKETTITLHTYLDSDSYETFMYLFPQYQAQFNTYSKKLQDIVQCMINDGKSEDLSVSHVASAVLQEFKSGIKFDLASKSADQKRRIFSEFITHPSLLNMLMPLF